jgi:CheY-like chemotaxis protein
VWIDCAQFLCLNGFVADTARDGAEALERLKVSPIDVVISDLDMPNIDGYQLASRIRGDGRWRRTRIAAVTGFDSSDVERKVRSAQFDALFQKPVDPHDLCAWIAKEPTRTDFLNQSSGN